MLSGSQELPISHLSSKAAITYKFVTYLCGPNDNQQKFISPTIFPHNNKNNNRIANNGGAHALDTVHSKHFTCSSSFKSHHNSC